MPFDCTKLNSYRTKKNKYQNAATTIENNMLEIDAILSYIEERYNNIFSQIDSSGDCSSGYLANLYSSKLSVVREHGNVIRTLLKTAVERLNGQLTKANREMNRYKDLERIEKQKKEEAEKLEAEGKI